MREQATAILVRKLLVVHNAERQKKRQRQLKRNRDNLTSQMIRLYPEQLNAQLQGGVAPKGPYFGVMNRYYSRISQDATIQTVGKNHKALRNIINLPLITALIGMKYIHSVSH